jgi:hypothetical protein
MDNKSVLIIEASALRLICGFRSKCLCRISFLHWKRETGARQVLWSTSPRLLHDFSALSGQVLSRTALNMGKIRKLVDLVSVRPAVLLFPFC